MDRLEKVLRSEKVINELKKELIIWEQNVRYPIDNEAIEKAGTFYVNLDDDFKIWIWVEDVEIQKKVAAVMKTLREMSESAVYFLDFVEIIEQYEAETREENKLYRSIAYALGEDIEEYEEED